MNMCTTFQHLRGGSPSSIRDTAEEGEFLFSTWKALFLGIRRSYFLSEGFWELIHFFIHSILSIYFLFSFPIPQTSFKYAKSIIFTRGNTYIFFHHTTCESTCDILASSAANQGDNTVSVAQGGTATPSATEQLLPPDRVFKRNIYL